MNLWPLLLGSAAHALINGEILLPEPGGLQLDGAGRHALEGVVAEAGAVVLHGHDALPGADHLPLVDDAPLLAVRAPGLDVLAEQIHLRSSSLPAAGAGGLQRMDDHLVLLRRDGDLGDGMVVAVDDLQSQGVLYLLLDGAAEIPGAVGGGIGLLYQVLH